IMPKSTPDPPGSFGKDQSFALGSGFILELPFYQRYRPGVGSVLRLGQRIPFATPDANVYNHRRSLLGPEQTMQPFNESVSQWLQQLKSGDPAAAQKLWERYFQS